MRRSVTVLMLGALASHLAWGADLAIAGSSTLYPVIAEAATVYDAAKLVVAQGGSGEGIKKTAEGAVAIGMASRELKESEKSQGLAVQRIGTDGIALVVQASNAATGITKIQAGNLFSGAITSWKDLGGDGAVTLVSLHEKHGTTDGFAHFLGLEVSSDPTTKAIIFTPKGGTPTGITAQRRETIADCLAQVARKPGSVTFAPIGSTLRLIAQGAPLKFLTVEGIVPSLKAVKEQQWPFTRPLNLVYKTPGTPEVQAFLEFMGGGDGQAMVEKYDFVGVE